VKAIQDHRSERRITPGRLELDALIRTCLGLRVRVLVRERIATADGRWPDFEETVPAAHASAERGP
jgi:hypothetical protein